VVGGDDLGAGEIGDRAGDGEQRRLVADAIGRERGLNEGRACGVDGQTSQFTGRERGVQFAGAVGG
jgi:hypothetical protein